MLTFGSLFAGIGGLDLGLERAGFEVRWQVDADETCRAVLQAHWPDVRRYGDVRGLTGLEPVDLIAGGFPCQDISNAGRGAGFEGEQSGLWAEFARIICEIRPRFVLVENVPGLLTRGRLGRVLGDLAASGYDAEWDCLPAAAWGAPHIRARIFLLAYPCGFRDEAERSDPVFAGRLQSELRPSWPAEPAVGRVDDGFPGWMVNRLGNSALPQIAEWIGRRIVDAA